LPVRSVFKRSLSASSAAYQTVWLELAAIATTIGRLRDSRGPQAVRAAWASRDSVAVGEHWLRQGEIGRSLVR